MQVLPTIVVIPAEMASHCVGLDRSVDFIVVPLESVHESAFCLSHILFVACFTGDRIHQIGAATGEVFLAPMLLSGDCACDFA